MNPSSILRNLPPKLSEKLFYRFFNKGQESYRESFTRASLRFAPKVTMHDLIVGDVISGQLALNGFYELDLTRRIVDLAAQGGVFVDVGANIGYFSLLWLAGSSGNRTYSVEASPRNQQLLENNISKNGFSDRATIICNAAGDREGAISFDTGPEDQTGWGGVGKKEDAINAIEVNMVRLDETLPHEPIEVMKIDVEGADTLVIQGCSKLLEKRLIGRIFFEQNPERMKPLNLDPGMAQDYLTSHNYRCYQIGDDEWCAEKGD